MIYIICVVKGQLDHVFSFKDDARLLNNYIIKCTETEMQFQWAMHNIIPSEIGFPTLTSSEFLNQKSNKETSHE